MIDLCIFMFNTTPKVAFDNIDEPRIEGEERFDLIHQNDLESDLDMEGLGHEVWVRF